ncbi:hypothetical protein HPT29_018565 [Microvirga terrae]|uniref:Uncharacterized protein n=1 Tax=Microvirga terrae TaxID=2740529 RepID=A0ABY5RMM5_9HYPH|nr:hypothetical protein [Microvirga terrae]UVF18476.1 hypothetical protein HPT29_018565 [Microvirga terrae]
MSNLSTAIVAALDLGASFKEHDPRPAEAAQGFYETLGADHLDALVETLWLIIEHPRATATQVLEAWHLLQVLKNMRRHL